MPNLKPLTAPAMTTDIHIHSSYFVSMTLLRMMGRAPVTWPMGSSPFDNVFLGYQRMNPPASRISPRTDCVWAWARRSFH